MENKQGNEFLCHYTIPRLSCFIPSNGCMASEEIHYDPCVTGYLAPQEIQHPRTIFHRKNSIPPGNLEPSRGNTASWKLHFLGYSVPHAEFPRILILIPHAKFPSIFGTPCKDIRYHMKNFLEPMGCIYKMSYKHV